MGRTLAATGIALRIVPNAPTKTAMTRTFGRAPGSPSPYSACHMAAGAGVFCSDEKGQSVASGGKRRRLNTGQTRCNLDAARTLNLAANAILIRARASSATTTKFANLNLGYLGPETDLTLIERVPIICLADHRPIQGQPHGRAIKLESIGLLGFGPAGAGADSIVFVWGVVRAQLR